MQQLIDACIQDEEKLYLCVSSPTTKDKPVQIRPWRLSDADFVLDASMPLDPRKTVFVGGVPRPLKAVELAMIMDRLYGGVCYAGIDTDPELKYPKGAGRVAFSNQQSYIAAISARFVQLQHGDIDKRVSKDSFKRVYQNGRQTYFIRYSGRSEAVRFGRSDVRRMSGATLRREIRTVLLRERYLLTGKFLLSEGNVERERAIFPRLFFFSFQYYCEHCWATIHSRPGREFHKPLVKEGADRPRAVPYRWC